MSASGNVEMLYEKAGDSLDTSTFEQILEMDEEETAREFSRSIVLNFFDQAGETFEEMDEAIKKKDLHALSDRGHFLKGSSATLGLTKIKDACEKIQHLGMQKDEKGTEEDLDPKSCLKRIAEIIPDMKKDYKEIKALLEKFYEEDPSNP